MTHFITDLFYWKGIRVNQLTVDSEDLEAVELDKVQALDDFPLTLVWQMITVYLLA